ncbi:MAG: hypothetical protein KAR42_04720 [candidate division Zixibacteria bacterium]|nr:hypothetical protein [candidate division Zixibacteria bacterium]
MKRLCNRNCTTLCFLTAILFAVALIGCSGDKENGWSSFLSSDGTGVRGLDTPDQILSNPYVKDALDEASDKGVNISPEKGVNPPVISGTYDLAGEACVPGHHGWYPLSGIWKWSNQTSDNHIDTYYEVGAQEGFGTEGEIIRGTGNRFTVYSVLDISDSFCSERGIMLFDGTQDNNGNVSGVYIITPVQDPVCHTTTIGRLQFKLTGAGKAAVKKGDGAFLMKILIKCFRTSCETK